MKDNLKITYYTERVLIDGRVEQRTLVNSKMTKGVDKGNLFLQMEK